MVPVAQTCLALQLLCPQGPPASGGSSAGGCRAGVCTGLRPQSPARSPGRHQASSLLSWGGTLGAPSLHGSTVAQLGHGQAAAHSFRPRPVSAGLLVAYCHRFDIQVQSSRVYFVACTIGKPTVRSPSCVTASSLYTVVAVSLFFLVFFVFLFSLLSSVCFVSKFIDTDRMLPHFLSSLVVSKMVQTNYLVPLGQLFRMSRGAEGIGPAAATSGPGRHRLAFPAGVPLSHRCPPSPGFLKLGPVLHAGPQGHSPRDQPVHTHPQVLPFEPQCVRLSCSSCH